MKIAIDFDDVMVDTVSAWCKIANANNIAQWEPKDFTDWDIPKRTGLSEDAVMNVFRLIKYTEIDTVPGAILAVKELLDSGHHVVILTDNPRVKDIRSWLYSHGLRKVRLLASHGSKATYALANGFDVIVDDKPKTLKDSANLGVCAVRFMRPWNANMEGWGSDRCEHSAQTWSEVLAKIRLIAYLHKQPAFLNYSKRNLFSNAIGMIDDPMDTPNITPEDIDGPYTGYGCSIHPEDTPLLSKLGDLDYRSPDQEAWDALEPGSYMERTEFHRPPMDFDFFKPFTDIEDCEPIITNAKGQPCRMTGMYDEILEPIITNAKGAKQTDIGARFDLLPKRAVTRVARVLHEGERKYGKDNWRGLSVDEILNHVMGHLFVACTEENLAHAACRILMALEVYLTEHYTIEPDDPGWEKEDEDYT